ncbi:2'-deoxycytidine 5'-triphosphate deaminase [Candidatus Woesearchaeota archaeon]|nr:2'-deoxycytidine 5'-triphosphate deaminase [Candidatus Woesearchaeota archaeon]
MPPSLADVIGSRPGMIVSQEFRELFRAGCWSFEKTDDLEARIQPNSFDPVIADTCYFLPKGFRPRMGERVLETLRHEYPWRTYKIDPAQGRLVSPGEQWLLPLDGYFRLPAGWWIEHSPKSTQGRLGNFVRLLADGSPNYDMVRGPWEGRLYVLFEPHAFHNLIFPGLSFNQLWVSCQSRMRLSDEDFKAVYAQVPLFYDGANPIPLDKIVFQDGLVRMTLDLEGKYTHGVVGLCIAGNPDPIDLRAKGVVDVQDFYDVRMAHEGKLQVPRDDPVVLVATREASRIPAQVTLPDGRVCGLAAKYKRDDDAAGKCQLDQAGFHDSGFEGSTVLEVNNEEFRDLILLNGQDVGGLEFFAARGVPDKVYGAGIGSSYKGQAGVRPARQFRPIDFKSVASKLDKNRELIMAVDAQELFAGSHFEGFKPAMGCPYLERLLQCQNSFVRRGPAEEDETLKQPIGYAVIVNPVTKKLFVYERSARKENYGEHRLFGKVSIGVGGHVRDSDKSFPNPIRASMERELLEEVELHGRKDTVHLGYINADATGKDVDRVHFGVLYVVAVDNDCVTPKSPELRQGRMMSLAEARSYVENFETWSRIALEPVERFLAS